MTDKAKSVLDKWATIVLKKEAVYIDSNGEARPNQERNQHYEDTGYSEDIVLWIPPKDCLRLEFESTPEENRKWIAEVESSAKSLEYDYCITEHRNAKSPYFNMFNIRGIPLNEDNRLAKMMLIEQLCPNQKARDSVDKTNLGWTFSPVIEHPHWKPKYNGAIHAIVRGTHPIEHENDFPKKFLKTIEKSKEFFKQASATAKDNHNWVIEFLTDYCLNNPLPKGERHNVIEKNLAIAIIHNPERDRLERQYVVTQHQTSASLQGWYSAILSGNITEINVGEITNYIKRNNIPFAVPDKKPEGDVIGVCLPAEPDSDGWIRVGESVTPPPAKRPEITQPFQGKLISTFSSEVVEHLKDRHELFYRFREFRVQKLEKMPVKDVKNRDVKVLGFKDMSPSEFITYIENYVIPCVAIYDPKTHKINLERKSITSELAKTLLETQRFKEALPLIDVIYDAPLPMLVGGELMFPTEGYDERFQSWLPFGSPTINPTMPLDDAISILNTIFGEFCFESEMDKAKAIAGLLTPFIRGLYSRPTCRTPIFFYKANRERAGKDYCAEITGIVMNGVANSEPPLADGKETHDEEFRKKILSTFRLGKNRLHLSNNKGFLNSAVLEFISTNENFSDRVLGSNTTLTFPNTLELSLSANTGITYTPDLANRCVFINLFLDLENPNERQFRMPDLHGWVKTHRGDVLSALYALVRNWHEKGMPNGKTLFSSFPEWARVCGGIMMTAGLGDPCVTTDESAYIGGDTETKDMKRLFELVFERWGSQPLFKRDILDVMMNGNDEAFREIFGYLDWSKEHSARTILGKIIDKYIGRILSGIRLVRVEDAHTERRKYIWSKIEKSAEQVGGIGGFGGLSAHPIQTNLRQMTEMGNAPNAPISPHTFEEEYISVAESPLENSRPLPYIPPEHILPSTRMSMKDIIRTQLSEYNDAEAKGVKISELHLRLECDFDELCEAIDILKSQGEIVESPSGTIRRLD
jgi:hypothetical protein